MTDSFDYGNAYEQISRDLKKALADRDRLDMKITSLRQTLTALSASCEQQGIEIEHSPEAVYLVKNSSLPDEILAVLRAAYPGYHRATTIKHKLEELGHDMSKYQNALATIHMILKRQIEAKKVETSKNKAGEKLFRVRKDWHLPQPAKAQKKKVSPFFGEL